MPENKHEMFFVTSAPCLPLENTTKYMIISNVKRDRFSKAALKRQFSHVINQPFILYKCPKKGKPNELLFEKSPNCHRAQSKALIIWLQKSTNG